MRYMFDILTTMHKMFTVVRMKRRNTRRQLTRRRRQQYGGNAEFLTAVRDGDYHTIENLIENGANIHTQDSYRYTPLYLAAQEGHDNIVSLLLEHGANVNSQTLFGDTPLHTAVDNWHDDIAKLLVENGADPNIYNKDFERPYDIAIDRGNEEMIEYLYEHTNDPDANNNNYSENNANLENNTNSDAYNLPNISTTPLSKTTIAEGVKQCFDPIMVNTINIIEKDDGLTIYVRNIAGKITNSYCVDTDYLTNMIQSENEVFYKCNDSVPVSALLIQPKNVQYNNPMQRVMMEVPYFTKRDQAMKMQVGKSYVFQETNESVGRIASRSVVKGGNVVSAKHCGPTEPGNLYEILEVVKTGGRRKTRRSCKH
jgi:hypothetical protein